MSSLCFITPRKPFPIWIGFGEQRLKYLMMYMCSTVGEFIDFWLQIITQDVAQGFVHDHIKTVSS